MKKFLLVLGVMGIGALVSAQTPEMTEKHDYEKVEIGVKSPVNPKNSRIDAEGWFDPVSAIEAFQGGVQGFRSTLFPDSSMLISYADGPGEVGTHSVGFVFDPRGEIYENTPFRTNRYNPITVDSMAFWYLYNRWNPDPNIVDTIRVETFLIEDMLFYINASFATVNYDPANNTAANGQNGASIETIDLLFTQDDTSDASFGERVFPVNRFVDFDPQGGNTVGMIFSYIPGDQSYSKAPPFDTLDAGAFTGVFNRFNQFEYQLIQDATAYSESDPALRPFSMRIHNNGMAVNTDIRYQLNGNNLDDAYYGATWVRNSDQTTFTQMPRTFFYVTANNVGIDEINADGYGLGDAYPNPSSVGDNVSIDFSIGSNDDVVIDLMDLTGKKVLNVTNDKFGAGKNTVSFSTSSLKPGIYLYKMTTSNFAKTLKLIVE